MYAFVSYRRFSPQFLFSLSPVTLGNISVTGSNSKKMFLLLFLFNRGFRVLAWSLTSRQLFYTFWRYLHLQLRTEEKKLGYQGLYCPDFLSQIPAAGASGQLDGGQKMQQVLPLHPVKHLLLLHLQVGPPPVLLHRQAGIEEDRGGFECRKLPKLSKMGLWAISWRRWGGGGGFGRGQWFCWCVTEGIRCILAWFLYTQSNTVANFLVPDWGDIVNSGIWWSYRPARLHRPMGRYANPMPESTISPC